jgi:hypothetical protein
MHQRAADQADQLIEFRVGVGTCHDHTPQLDAEARDQARRRRSARDCGAPPALADPADDLAFPGIDFAQRAQAVLGELGSSGFQKCSSVRAMISSKCGERVA